MEHCKEIDILTCEYGMAECQWYVHESSINLCPPVSSSSSFANHWFKNININVTSEKY